MSQVAFLIVFLFTLRKRKSVSAFGASDLDIWHVADSPTSAEPLTFHALALRNLGEPSCFVSLGLRQDEVAITSFSVRLRSPEFRNGQVGLSLLQRGEWFNKIGGGDSVLVGSGQLSANGAKCKSLAPQPRGPRPGASPPGQVSPDRKR